MWLKRTFKIFLLLLLLLALSFSLFIGSVYIGVFGPLPSESDLLEITNEEASLVYASDGTLIGKFFAENRTNIRWEDLPEGLVEALIATEDRRFFEHSGIDSRSYLRVIFKTLMLGDRSSGGGSTITQQLVKNLYGRGDHSFLSLPVSKVREALIAYRMEKVLSKQEILLLYLNSVPFGEEVFGVEAAAKRFFDKNAKDLHVEESAVLVGLLKANTWYNPRLYPENAVGRRNQVLQLMAEVGYLTDEEADRLTNLDLQLKYTNYQLESPAGYFIAQVRNRTEEILARLRDENGVPYDIRKDGLTIHTTLDSKLQGQANEAALAQLKKMQPLLDRELQYYGMRDIWEAKMLETYFDPASWKEKHKMEILTTEGLKTMNMSVSDSLWHYYKMLHAAVLAVDPEKGKVLAWTGGNHYRYLPYDLIYAQRQIASTVKPFIYAAALEKGFGPCDYFDNSLHEYEEYDGWMPENYDKSHSDKMKVAMWYALSRSLNLPTVDIYFQTGHEEISDLIRRFGLNAPYKETPALALGALDASLYELTRAYSGFANGGFIPDELIMIEKITDAEGNIIYEQAGAGRSKVMESVVSEEITRMLELAVREGTGQKMVSQYGIRSDLAGKTGTAQNYSDAWFICYTPDLVVSTWMGASSPEVHFRSGKGSGSVLALPVAGKILSGVSHSPQEREKYLTSFVWTHEVADTAFCEPFREKGLSGLINRMFKRETDPDETKIIEDTVLESPKEDRSKFRKFFDKLFRKKNKKKKENKER
jgi:penicillin-binding protein 1A